MFRSLSTTVATPLKCPGREPPQSPSWSFVDLDGPIPRRIHLRRGGEEEKVDAALSRGARRPARGPGGIS